jgi:thymidylate synthase
MVFTVEADSIAVAWVKTVLTVYNKGIDIPTEYKNNARTLVDPIAVHINKPFLEPKTCDDLSDFKSKAIEDYCKKFLEVGNTGHTYTYPNRLFDYPLVESGIDQNFDYYEYRIGDGDGDGFNQIQHIIDELKKSPISRRQIAHTWEPEYDAVEKHCPCLQTVQFSILNNELRLFAVFRSNDMLDAALANNNGLHTLQKYVANSLGVETGYMEIYSCFPHIYEERLDAAKRVVAGAGNYLSYSELNNGKYFL